MARKIFSVTVICAGFFLSISFPAFARDIKSSSKVTQVTIYPGAAIVTREAQIDVPAGPSTVLLENIVPSINENTLTVKGQGTADVKIYGASIKTEYLTEASNERVKDLQSQIEALDDEIQNQNDKEEILKKQKEYVESVKLFAGQQIPKDLVTKIPEVSTLEQVGAYVAKSFADLMTQSEEIRLKLRELNRKKDALNNQLQQLNSNNQNVKRSIAVEIEGVHPGQLTLTVSYLVGGVYWGALYDARVSFDKNKVDLSLFALVSQSTGEDWSDVNLTISTARPSIGGVMPELFSWTISPWETPPKNYAVEKGFVRNMRLAGGRMAYDEAMPAASAALKKSAETAYARTEQKSLSVVFKVTKPVTIKSDGTQHRVPITALTLPAQFEYASTPKLSPYTYLRSLVENNQESLLLPGRVNVFLDGDYVGSSAISKALGNKEKFDLYLGVDEGVTVKRELVEEKSDDTLFANIPSPNKVNRYTYKIKVENYKSKSITVNIFDHIPVSTDEKIKIKDLKFAPEPSRKDYKDRKGVMLWTLTLNPQEKKEITYSFAIERPKDLNVEGL